MMAGVLAKRATRAKVKNLFFVSACFTRSNLGTVKSILRHSAGRLLLEHERTYG